VLLGGALYLSLLPFDPIHSVNFSLLFLISLKRVANTMGQVGE
jgi:hypothetical protein